MDGKMVNLAIPGQIPYQTTKRMLFICLGVAVGIELPLNATYMVQWAAFPAHWKYIWESRWLYGVPGTCQTPPEIQAIAAKQVPTYVQAFIAVNEREALANIHKAAADLLTCILLLW